MRCVALPSAIDRYGNAMRWFSGAAAGGEVVVAAQIALQDVRWDIEAVACSETPVVRLGSQAMVFSSPDDRSTLGGAIRNHRLSPSVRVRQAPRRFRPVPRSQDTLEVSWLSFIAQSGAARPGPCKLGYQC